jgi:hypothetical protein
VLARELGSAGKSLPESGAEQVRGTRLMLRTGSSLTGTSAQRQASSTRVQVVEARASTIGMGGGIIDRKSGNTPRWQSEKSRRTSGCWRKTPGRTRRRLIPTGTEGTDDE